MGAVKQQAMEDAENILNVTAEKLVGGDITEDDALEILDNNMDNLEILGFENNEAGNPGSPNYWQKIVPKNYDPINDINYNDDILNTATSFGASLLCNGLISKFPSLS